MFLIDKQLAQHVQDTFGPKDPVVIRYGDERDYYELGNIPSWFWNIINAGAKDEEKILTVLREQTFERLFEFQYFFEYVAGSLNADAFLKHVSRIVSEDGMEDLTWWVVSQGKEYYLDVWEHPEKIPHESDYLDLEQSFYGQAENVYEEKTGKDLDDYNRYTAEQTGTNQTDVGR